jgi:NAD(P)-dependent dehydrogenase (short-subunit alcohol dehydrogenase family)
MKNGIDVALITGANRGIGLKHTKVLVARAVRVFATVRSPADATELHALVAAHAGRITLLSQQSEH